MTEFPFIFRTTCYTRLDLSYIFLMKKIFSVLAFFLFSTALILESHAAIDYSTGTSEYWQMWLQKFSNNTTYRASNQKTGWGLGYYRNRSRRVIKPRSWEPESTPVEDTDPPPVQSKRIYRSRTYTSTKSTQGPSMRINITPIRQKQSVAEVTSAPIRLFQIGVSNTTSSRSTDYVEPVELDTLTFQMYSHTGIAADPQNFSLILEGVEGQEFEFERNGNVTLRFTNARLAKGEDLSFNVSLRVDDPDNTPHVNGSLRIRVLDATAQTEQSLSEVDPVITGTSISDQISFTPIARATGNPVVSGIPATQIFGRTLSAGETAAVLALNFEAAYDDMLIEEITVRDTLSSNSIDSFVNRLTVKENGTGRVLGQGRFSQGKSRIHFSRPIEVKRNSEAQIYFEVQLSGRINLTSQNTEFKLDVDPTDVVVYGIGSGKEVPDSNKNFSFQSEKFLVVDSGGSMRIAASGSQPNGFSSHGALEPIYRFYLQNPSNDDVSIGRLSFEVRPTGVQFQNGISTDDFELKQIVNGRDVNGLSFAPTSASGNKVTFDAITEFFLHRHDTAEFALKVKLEDVGGDYDNDYVSVQILGDSSLNVNTLSSVRSSGANFIWSDHSGRPHTTSSQDWLSGYLVNGLPTGFYINRRDDN